MPAVCANHYNDVIMRVISSQITSLTIVYSTVYSAQIKKTTKLRVTGLCAKNSPGTGEFPAQMASNAVNVSIWWRHHRILLSAPPGQGWHIFVRIEVIVFSSEDGLSPFGRQFDILINAGLFSIGPIGTNFGDILLGIHNISSKKMYLRKASAKWHHFVSPLC